ncbi:MAG TPA: hypothetical protein VGH86_12470 [Phenylobacterium sp.]
MPVVRVRLPANGGRAHPAVDGVLRALIRDIAERSSPDVTVLWFKNLDDKRLFPRTGMEPAARAAGFDVVRFTLHNTKPNVYREMTKVQLRLATGRDDLTLPDWAITVLDSFDAALTADAKSELMPEATIVLTKAAP